MIGQLAWLSRSDGVLGFGVPGVVLEVVTSRAFLPLARNAGAVLHLHGTGLLVVRIRPVLVRDWLGLALEAYRDELSFLFALVLLFLVLRTFILHG